MFVPETTKNRIKVYEQKNVIQKNDKLGHYFISFEKYECMKSFSVSPEEIIVSCAGTIGEIYQLPKNAEIGIINQALMKIHLYYLPLSTYFILYFDFVLKTQTSEKGKGTCIKNIPPLSVLKEMLVPLPPEGEILRILDKIKMICTYTDLITKEEQSIKTLSNAVKTKILDYFFGDNSSYKSYYPNYQIKDLCKLDKNDVLEQGLHPYLEAKVIRGKKTPEYIQKGSFIKKMTKIILVDGENSGEVMIAPCDGYLGSTFRILNANEKINDEYLMWFIEYYKKSLKSNRTGSAVPHLNKKIFYELKIPLPPINIQEVVVSKITNFFNQLDIIIS